MDENDLCQWILWRTVNEKLIINLRMHETGRYALEIYEGKGATERLLHISTYLVNVPKRIKFPEIPNQHAGETKENSK